MLDEAFLQQVLVYLAFDRGVENLLLDDRVDRQLLADLERELFLAAVALRLFELLEQLLDLAVIFLEERDGILGFGTGHG